jgi:hypothetical protein
MMGLESSLIGNNSAILLDESGGMVGLYRRKHSVDYKYSMKRLRAVLLTFRILFLTWNSYIRHFYLFPQWVMKINFLHIGWQASLGLSSMKPLLAIFLSLYTNLLKPPGRAGYKIILVCTSLGKDTRSLFTGVVNLSLSPGL